MLLADSTILFAICGDTLTEYLHFQSKELIVITIEIKNTLEKAVLSYTSTPEHWTIFLYSEKYTRKQFLQSFH